VEPALTRPPLPKLAWLAAAVALLNAAYLIFAALSAQTVVALPVALIPLIAGIGILRRNVWSARGFALFQLCGIVLVLFLGPRTTLTSADRASLIASAFLTLLLVLLGHKITFSCKIVLWDYASPRQAHKRDVSRHIWRAWQPPRDMKTGTSL
jgi:hypothetical protein